MNTNVLMLILSAFSGILGTGIGGIVGATTKNKSKEKVGSMLAFAAGIMLGIVAFEMLPSAVQSGENVISSPLSKLSVIGCILAGICFAYLVNLIVEKADEKRQNTQLDARKQQDASGLKRAGVVTLAAIAFHNIPEGMAIGASGVSSLFAGVAVAFAIALHNVPEGMAISAPLVSGGMKSSKAVFVTLIAGACTLVGAVVGVFVGGIGEAASCICLSLASGAMIEVACFDLLPISVKLRNGFASFSFCLGGALSLIFALFD